MKWADLKEVLQQKVTAGSVTTYAEVSAWAYGGIRNRNQPVRALLMGAANHGYRHLTNRVVRTSGALAALPDGQAQQRAQLIAELIPFNQDGCVDFVQTTPVELAENAEI